MTNNQVVSDDVEKVAFEIAKVLHSDLDDLDSLTGAHHDDMMNAARAAIAALSPQWQPIDSAPKKRKILVKFRRGKQETIIQMQWDIPVAGYADGRKEKLHDQAGWYSPLLEDYLDEKIDGWKAVEWMDIPAAPQRGEG